VGITEAPTAPTGTLTGLTAPTAPEKPIPASSSYLQEPVLDNYPTYEPNDSLQLDGIGGYIGEGIWGGHIDKDIYGVSDGEQEARRPAGGQQDDQDDAEIARLATCFGGQSLEPSGSPIPEREPTGSPISGPTDSPILEPTGNSILEPTSSPIPEPTRSPIPAREPTWSPIPDREPARGPISEREPSEVELGESSTAARLIEQLYSFQGCTDEAHQAHDDEHAQFHLHPREEPCHSFADLLHLQELKPNGPVTDVLTKLTLMEKGPESPKFDPALAQQLYEGRGPTMPLSEWMVLQCCLCVLYILHGLSYEKGWA
jgi:hypothetical protein